MNKPTKFQCLEEAKIYFKKSNTALHQYGKRRNEKAIASLEEYTARKSSFCELKKDD